MPAVRLRASVWQSVFTHDLRRYRRTLYTRMRDFPTLITGPSGTGKFSAVGDTAMREFSGKLIAATNRDLPAHIQSGRFREDLYYRLCADLIQTPSLREQIADSPAVLHDLILFMVRRSVGDEA